jgi:hypothetical protein
MSDLFWEGMQQRNIRAASGDAQRARRAASNAQLEVDALEERLERMSLGLQALWELCRERLQLSDEDLFARIRDVDLRDGKLDSRLAKSLVACSSCGRANAQRRVRCLYCAKPLAVSSV